MRTFVRGHTFIILLLVLISYLSLSLIFQYGMYSGHDIWHQVARLYHFADAVNHGQLLPTWVATLSQGYGYPLFYFSYHLPWLLSLPFVWAGVGIFATLKILFFIGFMLSGLSMYYSAFLVTKNKIASFGAALVYLLSPHHFFSVFVSASIGTVYQFIFIPLIFSLITVVILHKLRYPYVIYLSIAIVCSILSHFMSFVFIAPFIALYAVILVIIDTAKEKKVSINTLFSLSLSALLVLGLAAYYLLPMIQLLPFIKAGNSNDAFSTIYQNNFADFKQLLYSKWGYGPIINNAKDGEVSLQIGVIQWLAVLAGVLLMLMTAIKAFLSKQLSSLFSKHFQNLEFKQGIVLIIFTVFFILSLFLMQDVSKPVWEWIVQYLVLDYPFRYLLLAVFLSSFIFGLVTSHFKSVSLQMLFVLFGVVVAWYTNRNHMKPNMFTDYSLKTYIDSEITTNTFHEYLPKDAESSLLSRPQPISTQSAALTIEEVELTPRGLIVNVLKTDAGEITLHQFDFPGQQVQINGEIVKHSQNEDGLITVAVPKGHSLVETMYVNTATYKIALLISALTGGFCILTLIRKES